VYTVLDSMNETMSIPTGLYPNLDLWNANKLHYITSASEEGFSSIELVRYSSVDTKQDKSCVISGFHRKVHDNCALLVYYAV